MSSGIDIKELKQFLVAANKAGYASGKEKQWVKEKDGSTTIEFTQGEWKSHDNFFGGEPYGGRTVVFYKRKPVWIMVYYGRVVEGANPDLIYPVLRAALKMMPAQSPFRGPKEYRQKEFEYKNSWRGDVDNFSGEEHITSSNKVVYNAKYIGGWVDKRTGV